MSEFGFTWGLLEVTRMAQVARSNGEYRCLRLGTPRDCVEVYVSPTGKLRVFRPGKGEMKVKGAS